MNNINRDYIEDYIGGLLPERKGLKPMEDYAEENFVPIIQPEVAQFLKVILKINKPKRILEIGTAIGYSAIVMAENTDSSTQISTIERNDDMVDLANQNISKFGYKDRIKVLRGEAEDKLVALEGKYDFIFLDAAKGQYRKFFDESMRLIDIGGIIVCDNVLFRGMVANEELVDPRKATIVKRLREFLIYINKLEGYSTSIIPIGDGIALTYRED